MTNLLIGNGLSISISNEFAYSSLKEKVSHKFSPPVSRLFARLDTDDFEHILTKIKDAKDVIEAITDGQITFSGKITDEVKSKLIEAVQSMNPSSPSEHDFDPQSLNLALKNYKNVYTTNYDIYLYWACLGDDGFNIVDYFFADKKFDRNRVKKKNGQDAIYFLHGELDIYGHSLNPDVDGHIVDAIKQSDVSKIRYYYYNLHQLEKFKLDQLQSGLNARLNREVEIVDSAKHSLSR